MKSSQDVVIVGAGIIGSSIARQLSQYQLNITLLDQASDVSCGTTKANSAIIHAGYDAKPQTLQAKYNVQGSLLWPLLAKELAFPYRQLGSLVLSFDEKQDEILKELLNRGQQNGVSGLEIWNQKKILREEPALSSRVHSALYAPSAAIVCPYQAAIALTENAIHNGVTWLPSYPVKKISQDKDGFVINDEIHTRYLINASGVNSDKVAALIGDTSFTISPRRGEYLILDKQQLVNHVLFQTPTPLGKGVLLAPTVDGNVLLGPTAIDCKDPTDTQVTQNGIDLILSQAKAILKDPVPPVISGFAGIRALAGDDFIVGPSQVHPHFFNCAGIGSPGLASSPAIALAIRDYLQEAGLKLIEKPDFDPCRHQRLPIHSLSNRNKDLLIQENPNYGKIVCRCETISEQEIIDAITAELPALTLDGLKRRLRVGMGRCQGGFCTPRLLRLLEQYGHLKPAQINKNEPGSNLIYNETKGARHA